MSTGGLCSNNEKCQTPKHTEEYGKVCSVCPYIVFYPLCPIFYFIFLEEKLVRLLSTLAHHVDISHCICFECCVFTVEKLYFYYVYSFYFIMFDCSVDVGAVMYNALKI